MRSIKEAIQVPLFPELEISPYADIMDALMESQKDLEKNIHAVENMFLEYRLDMADKSEGGNA